MRFVVAIAAAGALAGFVLAAAFGGAARADPPPEECDVPQSFLESDIELQIVYAYKQTYSSRSCMRHDVFPGVATGAREWRFAYRAHKNIVKHLNGKAMRYWMRQTLVSIFCYLKKKASKKRKK